MKKTITLLLAALLLLSIVGCAAPDEEVRQLQLGDPRGTFYLGGIPEEYIVYEFEEPNAHIAVYELEHGMYILGQKDGDIGNRYASTIMPGYEFLGVSESLWLFEGEDGKVAVDFLTKTELGIEVNIGDFCYPVYKYDELTQEEKDSFVYWSWREWVKKE